MDNACTASTWAADAFCTFFSLFFSTVCMPPALFPPALISPIFSVFAVFVLGCTHLCFDFE